MKIAVTVVRILTGLLFLFASITYFLNVFPQPELSGDAKTFTDGLAASGYIMPVVKTFELLCGLAFVFGRFVPLAVVVIFPIAVNILLTHAFLLPDGLPLAVALFAAVLFLAYANLEKYIPLLAAK
jgi:putative oxidoreductase